MSSCQAIVSEAAFCLVSLVSALLLYVPAASYAIIVHSLARGSFVIAPLPACGAAPVPLCAEAPARAPSGPTSGEAVRPAALPGVCDGFAAGVAALEGGIVVGCEEAGIVLDVVAVPEPALGRFVAGGGAFPPEQAIATQPAINAPECLHQQMFGKERSAIRAPSCEGPERFDLGAPVSRQAFLEAD
ncbi:MAG TPA: hypothetical protein VJR89_04775 [Polyangiales bacterium]|nr:hypothetical protein [Polyangiales bacterium]